MTRVYNAAPRPRGKRTIFHRIVEWLQEEAGASDYPRYLLLGFSGLFGAFIAGCLAYPALEAMWHGTPFDGTFLTTGRHGQFVKWSVKWTLSIACFLFLVGVPSFLMAIGCHRGWWNRNSPE